MGRSLKKLGGRIIPTVTPPQCIAKKKGDILGMSTIEHSRIMAYVSRVFIRKLPRYIRKRINPNVVFLLGLMHDIGKVSPGFLKKIYGDHMEKISPKLHVLPQDMFETKHAAISEAFFLSFFNEIKNDDLRDMLAKIVGAHHGKRGVEILNHDNPRYGGKEWSDLRIKIAKKLLVDYKPGRYGKIKGIDAELYAGILSLSDWIASDERMFDPIGKTKDIIKETIDAVDKLGWKKTKVKKGLSFSDLFGFKPRPEQQAFIDLVKKPGVYIMEASTGSGKTEAALTAAYNLISEGHHTGLYFSLPTRITSERIFTRVDKFLLRAFEKGMAPHLIHGQSIVSEVNIGGGHLAPGGRWFSSNRRALLLPFGIGTLDQLLMSVLNSKYNFIRTLGMAEYPPHAWE